MFNNNNKGVIFTIILFSFVLVNKKMIGAPKKTTTKTFSHCPHIQGRNHLTENMEMRGKSAPVQSSLCMSHFGN